MFCKHCRSLMKSVMRFEDGKSYRLYRCPKCYSETKPKRFTFDNEEISKNNTKTNKSKKSRLRNLQRNPLRKPIKRKEVDKCIALM